MTVIQQTLLETDVPDTVLGAEVPGEQDFPGSHTQGLTASEHIGSHSQNIIIRIISGGLLSMKTIKQDKVKGSACEGGCFVE